MSKGSIAPHISNEVRLVLGGFKPLGTIEKSKDPYGFALAVAVAGTGMLSHEIQHTEGGVEVVFTRPSNAGWIQHYNWLLKYGKKLLGIKEYHRRMGRVFGYTEEDIESFISSDIHCDCNKCRG